MKQVSMKYLAKELNLSTATISKALRDAYDISEETKQRVITLAKKLGYAPNAHASSLRGRKSRTLALVIPEVADSFFAQAINGIESVAQQEGYHVLIYLTHECFNKEQAILQELQGAKADGVILSLSSSTKHYEHITQLENAGIPVVLFDRVAPDVGNGQIVTDDEKSAYQLGEHLLMAGCKRIAFLTLPSSLHIIQQRLNGFKRAMDSHPVMLKKQYIVTCKGNEKEDLEILKELLSDDFRPDGIIASVEKLSAVAYLACNALNLMIPHDVKIAAFSNLQIAGILNPPLTTITQPAFKMGYYSATLLFKILKNKPIDQEERMITIPSIFEIRRSTNSTSFDE